MRTTRYGEERTYRVKSGRTKARAAVKPVIVTQLVDLDALLVLGLMRHRLRHHQQLRVTLGGEGGVGDQIGSDVEMLLER